jgi:hypothetical protein
MNLHTKSSVKTNAEAERERELLCYTTVKLKTEVAK